MERKTIKYPISCVGIGQYTGKIITINLLPNTTGSGIFFKRTDIEGNNNIISLFSKANQFDTTHLNTKISNGDISITMIEHLLSALWGLSITDIEIDINGDEMPMLDGSSKCWVKILKSASILELPMYDRKIVNVNKELVVSNDIGSIRAKPYDGLKITYEIDFQEKSIGHDIFTFDSNKNNYFTEIANARTFCTEQQVEQHKKLKKHFSNIDIVICGDKMMCFDGYCRFKNEPSRHKVLDLIGDLYANGYEVKGEFYCYKSGHALNRMIVEKIFL